MRCQKSGFVRVELFLLRLEKERRTITSAVEPVAPVQATSASHQTLQKGHQRTKKAVRREID
jgi:hypothetical protein